jgi:hypothetical protein
MAKYTVYLHVGPAVPGLDALHEALRDDPALAAAGVVLPDVDQDLLDRADTEIRRRHKALGLRRKDVEGSWAKVCRRAFKAKRDVLVCQPGLADATPDQVALAVDGLMGMRLHVVVTPTAFDGGTDVDDAAAELVGAWAPHVRRASRVHVLPVDTSVTAAELGTRLAHVVELARRAEDERRLAKRARQRLGIAA